MTEVKVAKDEAKDAHDGSNVHVPNGVSPDEAEKQNYLFEGKRKDSRNRLVRGRKQSTYSRLREIQGEYLNHGQKRKSKRHTPDPHTTPLDKSWKAVSATHLLRHVLIRHDTKRWASWVRTVAAMRTKRVSVVVLQLMLRESMLPRATDPRALPLLPALLPDEKTWEEILAQIQAQGYSHMKLKSYAYILSAQSNTERIERFLEHDDFKPLFIFSFLLRCRVERIKHLEALIQYCRRWYTARREGPQAWQSSVPLLTVDLNDHGHPLRLLLDNCYHLDPRLLPDIAEIGSSLFTTVSNSSRQDSNQLRQSRIFNQVICLFRQSNYGIIPKRKLPAAYTWAALEILLNASASLEKPCVTSLQGFRAIKEVMASQNRDQKDLRIIPRLSEAWPPYFRPGDGMDEATEPDENWSRAVLASAFMQENGYAKEEADLALDALQGMAPDGSPTIHQNEIIARTSGMRLWEASIMATRNSVEAWQLFQRRPGDRDAKPTIQEYTAMFQKLLYKDVDPSDKAFPGDRNLNFPTSIYNSFTELEQLRLQPPSVEDLYVRMRSENICLDLRCLCLLVSHASSMQEVSSYIYESTLPSRMKKAFTSWEAWDASLLKSRSASNIAIKFFPVFATAVMRLSRPSGQRIRKIVERAIDVLRAAGTHGPVQMAGFWPSVFGALEKHCAWPLADPKEQLVAILHTARLTENAGQMSLAAFGKMADAVRSLISLQLDALSTDGLSPSDFMLDFYDPQVEDMHHVTATIEDFYARGGAMIDSSIGHSLGSGLALAKLVLRCNFARLVQEEQHAQSLLKAHPVPPLERMMNRQDPVQAEQVQSLVSALLHLGDFEEAARVLKWAVAQWMEADVVDALRYLDDDAGFHVTFCIFRKLAEPMLTGNVVRDLRILITSENSPFRWPGADEVEEYFSTVAGESEVQLAAVLEHVRSRKLQRRAVRHSADNTQNDEIGCTLEGETWADQGHGGLRRQKNKRACKASG